MPKLSVELSDEDHVQLKIKSARLGLSQAEVVRCFLSAWFERRIELPRDRDGERYLSREDGDNGNTTGTAT